MHKMTAAALNILEIADGITAPGRKENVLDWITRYNAKDPNVTKEQVIAACFAYLRHLHASGIDWMMSDSIVWIKMRELGAEVWVDNASELKLVMLEA